METRIIEVTNGPNNWGKFLVGRFDVEWAHESAVVVGRPLLRGIGMHPGQYLVLDLQTCEGALFAPHGVASADLNKHRIWVCPLYQPFLEWLYALTRERGAAWWEELPAHVDLPEAPFALAGYRRTGEG